MKLHAPVWLRQRAIALVGFISQITMHGCQSVGNVYLSSTAKPWFWLVMNARNEFTSWTG